MALTLNLTSEIEQYLSQKATEKGLSLEAYVLKLLKDTILEQEKRLFVTLYAKSTDKMPRQHTSNPKIPKVSKAIASPFY
ncbi:MAG: hypothetical protein RLZZ580_3284 [Cyanobacteriota bacterium]|jgi:plasmid stability protein